ncbi:hypothetical protein [uncultured phage MedDCM-OCT-S11-C1836]|nr:hypothetical protein [uncultured phage MedDCM-OCT-S11-C1836]
MALQQLRSSTANKRPTAAAMSDGQLAVNTNATNPGLFFKDADGSVRKVGPVFIGSSAPNSSPATGGSTGHAVGEQWLDNTGGTYVLKIWDGTAWRSESGTFVDVSGDTMTGDLVMNNANLVFEGATADDFETTLTVTDPTADRTIALPNVSGTVVTTGDTGTVTSTMIVDGTIVNADVNTSAAIAGTKISPDFGSQNVTTTGKIEVGTVIDLNANGSAYFASNVGIGVTSPSTKLHVSGGSGTAFTLDGSNDYSSTASIFMNQGRSEIRTTINASGGNPGGSLLFRTRNNAGSLVDAITIDSNQTVTINSAAGTNPLIVSDGGAEAMRIDSAGRLLVGVTSNYASANADDLVIGSSSSSTERGITLGSTVASAIRFADAGNASAGMIQYVHNAGGTDYMNFYTNATERLRIDSSGRLLVGTSSARAIEPYGLGGDGQIAHTYESVGDTAPGPGIALGSSSTTARMGPYLYLFRSRGGSVGSNTSVSSGDNLGTVSFAGSDGTDVRTRGAAIYAEVDGTPGANDMPGRLVFSTTADGASSPTERMRIDSAGKVAIGTSSSQGKLTVQQSAVSNAPSRNAVLYLENNGNCEIQMVANSNNNVQLRMGTSGNSFDGALDYDVADHKLDVYTNTTKQVTITSTGNVGIGTQTTTAKLTVSDNSGTGYKNLLDMHASSAGQNPLMRLISRNAANTSTTSVDIYKVYQSGFTINNTDTAASNFTSFNVGASEGMRIDSSGRLLVGTSSNYGLTTNAVFAGNSSKGVVSIINDGDTFLNTNDLLGAVEFGGHESGGTAYIGASIQAECDSVWTGDSPGRLVFATTANSASSPTPRMRINSSGSLKITANTNVDNIYSYAAATGTSAVCFRGGHSATAGNPGVGTDSIYIFANGNIQNTNDSYGQISDIKLKETLLMLLRSGTTLRQLDSVSITLRQKPGMKPILNLVLSLKN